MWKKYIVYLMELTHTTIGNVWGETLEAMKSHVSEIRIATWLSKARPIKIDENGEFIIAVSSELEREYIQKEYLHLVSNEINQRIPEIKSVKIVVSKRAITSKNKKIESIEITKNNTNLNLESVDNKSNLNTRMTFKEFIVTPDNSFAHGTAQHVVNNLGISYNPCFFFGNTGVGKTHLIQAMGNKVLSLHPSLKVKYITSEVFSDSYFNAINASKVPEWREQERSYDVYIIDDVQFFAKKQGTQEELFHLFNKLINRNKQIILASDMHPNEIGFEDRVRSRFSSGIIVDIQSPSNESRFVILKKKAEKLGIKLDEDVLEYIIENTDGSVREIQSVLNTILAFKEINQKTINLINVKSLIKNNTKPKTQMNHKEVIRKICEYYEIDQQLITTKSRKSNIVETRQMIMYVLREMMDIPFSSIGQTLGGKDHTTVMHACEKVKSKIEKAGKCASDFERIKKTLNF